MSKIPYSQVTPQHIYVNRRKFLAAGLGLAGSAVAAKLDGVVKSPLSTKDEKVTPMEAVTTYNNYYEFGTSKDAPARNATNFKTQPWQLVIEGEVGKPKTYDLDSIMKLAPLEERVYRMRCVEAWSMVIPWVGFSLSEVIKRAEPTAKAKYVAFQTYYDPRQMPQARYGGLPFPYIEGLRLDEAMHPLTMLSSGIYGETLPPQNGAPLRLVVPWKYGFKNIKSIVKIKLQEKQPNTTWALANNNEYGFYSNVNPAVDHPRWTQSKERRIGEFLKRDTLLFNGYGDQVAKLYSGMDLKKNF